MGLAKVISVAFVLVSLELGFTTCCNHVLLENVYSLTSPNYPDNYPDNLNCSWLIQTDAPIILTFTNFYLDSCCDFITIYDGLTTLSPILFDASSKSDSVIASTSKNVLVTFTSDESDSTSGFKLFYSSSDCNQVISSESGEFGSPRDRLSSNCRWYFNSEKPIVFTFPWFYVEDGSSFTFLVFDGIKQTSMRLFGTTSNRNRPSVIRTTTNQALVVYSSDNLLSGFTANYSSNQCQDVLLSESGKFTSPNHPLNYPDGANCRWLIKGDNPISLSFSRFDMADNNDGITIYEGATESSEILYQSFSSKDAVPSSVVSIGNEMLIIFSSDGSGSSSGFYANYEPFSCKYVIESNSGWFSSPKYPKNYPDNLKCSWLIKAEKQIVITFLAFDLEKDKDWLTIYDGSSAVSKSRLLKTSSNETIPSLIKTSYGQAFIAFTSDESGSSSGFNATFEPYRCHHVLSSDSGWFSSPNYPKKYPNNFTCSLLINSTQPISLSFTQFKVQENDWIEIFDGPTNSSRLLWKSSFKTPSLILSTTHQLFVTFTSDDYGSDSGFNATYSPSRCPYLSLSDYGGINSPNYPTNYPDNLDICLLINATQPIQLSFNSFRLQANKDWLTVYDGPTTAYQLLKASSKEIPSPIISNSNQMLVIMTSDASKSLSGFKATYEPYRCQYELSASESGWFASPNYPRNYPGNANCSWLISGTNRISLSFLHFDMQSSDDWIKIYDGPTTESTQILKTSDRSSIPSPVVSTTNQILVVFVSDREKSSTGFNATYSECQTSENGWFSSPNYPQDYPNNANICWLINAKVPHMIWCPGRFHLQYNRDWLTVYNGPSQSSQQLLHWSYDWGNAILSRYTSTSNQILVTFTSDGDGSNPGFNLTYSPDGCTYVNADVQPKWFTSQYYPDNYRRSADDCWLINSTHPMILSFSRFELEADKDWLSVYDGPLITSNQLLKASTNYTIPSSIVSTANQVLVTFTSDTFDNFIGFNATYSNYYPGITERPVECNDTIHVNSTGFVLTSLNYPSSYPNIRCQWHFVSDPDTRIEISFTDFSTQPEDYVSVFNWKTNRDPNYALLFASGLNNSLPSLSCNYLSVTNLMHVFFNPLSDPSTNQLMPSKAGFRALLSVTSVKECGGSFNKSEGVLLGYQNNTRHLMFSGCVWYIRAETDSHVKLTLSINSGSNKSSAFSYSLKVYEVNLLETDGIFPLNEYDFSSDSQPFSVSSTNNDITVMLNDTTKYDKCRPRDYPQLNLSYHVIANSA